MTCSKAKEWGDGTEGSMKNRLSGEVLLELDNRTAASLSLDYRHHGAYLCGEKEPAKRKAKF